MPRTACAPPGTTPTSGNYGGYCFFNNAAIAAEHIATTTGSKVSVLDVDYHHGNGTQEIFYERGDVQYVSLHGDPVPRYPYVIGYADETGAGDGAGCNLNIPLPPGTDDDRYLIALVQGLDSISAFGPSTLVVSLGIDTFVTDPICDFALTTEGFAEVRRGGRRGRPADGGRAGGRLRRRAPRRERPPLAHRPRVERRDHAALRSARTRLQRSGSLVYGA